MVSSSVGPGYGAIDGTPERGTAKLPSGVLDPQRQRQLEPPLRVVQRIPEQIAQAAQPVAQGLDVHMQRFGRGARVALGVEPRGQGLAEALAGARWERLERGERLAGEVRGQRRVRGDDEVEQPLV